MKKIIQFAQYLIMFGLSAVGYFCLPDMLKMWKNDCVFVSITDKQTVFSDSNSANLYRFDNDTHVWDRAFYSTGDIVCVKKQM